MTCRYEKTARWREGRGENFSVIYLILLSHFSFPIASLLHFACQPRSLKYIYLSVQIKFSPVPSLSHSIISTTLYPFFLLPFPPFTICLSHQNKVLHSHTQRWIFPSCSRRESIKLQFSNLCVTSRKSIIMSM